MRHIHWMLAIALTAATGMASAKQGADSGSRRDQPASATATKTDVAPDAQAMANMDPAQRAGYEASKAFHKDPSSTETANAIRRLFMAADGRLPEQQQATKTGADDGDD